MFDAPCRYDVIAGRDFMLPNGMTPNMNKKVVTWFNYSIPMRQPELNQEDYNAVVKDFLFQMEDEYFEEKISTDLQPT